MFLAAATGIAVAPAVATHAPSSDVIGEIREHLIVAEDTLADIAIAYEVGYVELVAANPGIDPWLPPPGHRLRIPSAHVLPDGPRQGIVVNLADQRLYVFRAAREPSSFPIAIGSDGIALRTGLTRVVAKRRLPTWYPPPSVREADPELPASEPLMRAINSQSLSDLIARNDDSPTRDAGFMLSIASQQGGIRMFKSLLSAPRWSKESTRDEDVFGALQRDVNRLFEDFTRGFVPRLGGARGEAPWSPDVDVKHATNEVVLSMDLPGVDDKDVEIVVRDDIITIKGERRSEKSEKGENYEFAERSYGRFERALQLPFHIDDKKVSAAYAKGVLTISIPKPPEAKLAETKIPISTSAAPAKAA